MPTAPSAPSSKPTLVCRRERNRPRISPPLSGSVYLYLPINGDRGALILVPACYWLTNPLTEVFGWMWLLPLPGRSCVVVDPGMHGRSLRGNREISSLATCTDGVVRIGKARSHSR